MNAGRPALTCRRSPSPQRGVLTLSINYEDECDGANLSVPVQEEKDWKSSVDETTTAGRRTRSLPCSPQRRLVDERHNWIEEKILSFDEKDTVMLVLPTFGKGELVENRRKWIHKEIVGQKSMQQASPRFDEGKYEPTWVAMSPPETCPHSTRPNIPTRKKNVGEADSLRDRKRNSIDDVDAYEFIDIVEVVSSVEETEQEAEVRNCPSDEVATPRKATLKTFDSLKFAQEMYPCDEVDSPKKATVETIDALDSVQESVSQENVDGKLFEFQLETKPSSSVSLCDTISMEDFEVPTASHRDCKKCADLVSGELPAADDRLSMEAIAPKDSRRRGAEAMERFAVSYPVVTQEYVHGSSPSKAKQCKPLDGESTIKLPFVGDIETPHKTTPIQLTSLTVHPLAGDFETVSQNFGENQHSPEDTPTSDDNRFRRQNNETHHIFASPDKFDQVASVEPSGWLDVPLEGASTVATTNLKENERIEPEAKASLFGAESGTTTNSISSGVDFGCAAETGSIPSINAEVEEDVVHEAATLVISSSPVSNDLVSHEGEHRSKDIGSTKTANEAPVQHERVSTGAFGDTLVTENDETRSHAEDVTRVNQKSRMIHVEFNKEEATVCVKQSKDQACQQDGLPTLNLIKLAAALTSTVPSENANFRDQSESNQAENTSEPILEVVPASEGSFDKVKMKYLCCPGDTCDNTAEFVFDIAPAFEDSMLGDANTEKVEPESSTADACVSTKHEEDAEVDKTDAMMDEEVEPRSSDTHNMELIPKHVAQEGSHNPDVQVSDQNKTNESETTLEGGVSGRMAKRNDATIENEGLDAFEASGDSVNTPSLDKLTGDNDIVTHFVMSTSLAEENHIVNVHSSTDQYFSSILMTEGVQERIASMDSWDLLFTNSTTDMYLGALKSDESEVMSQAAPNIQQNTFLDENEDPDFGGFEGLLEDAPVAKVEPTTWDAVADYLICASPCNNQNAAPTTFDESRMFFSNDSLTDKYPGITDIAIGSTTPTADAPLESPPAVSPAASPRAYSVPSSPIHSENQAPAVTAEKQGATVLAKTDAVPPTSAGDPLSVDHQSTETKNLCTPALEKESVEAPTSPNSIQSTTSTTSDMVAKVVVDHARRSKDRLRKAKAFLLVDFPTPPPRQVTPFVDPALLLYKKQQLEKAKKLLTELDEVQKTVATAQKRLEQPYNAFPSLAQSASEESQTTVPNRKGSPPSDKNNETARVVTELASPFGIHCMDHQCSIS